jgi:predicted RNA-binding protein with PIN domain
MGWWGVFETVAVMAIFAGGGFAWAAGERWSSHPPPAYPRPSVENPQGEPSIWLLDGFNVLHAGLLGGRDRAEWWTEPRRSELLARAGRFDDPRAEVWVVFDGPRPEPESEADGRARQPRRVFSASADEWLLAQVRAAKQPGHIAVVTSDRKLADRVRHRGAQVVSPQEFLDRCST